MAPKSVRPKVPKRSAGLVISPPAPRPPEDNPSLQIFREAKEAEKDTLSDATPLLPSPPTQESAAVASLAPKRDFTKVPNSVTRDAVPAGLFKGTSKKLYDALYHRTRGAFQPVRQIKARQSDLMAWARVSRNTLRSHLRHLEAVGLIITRWDLGDNEGAVYEVFTPEEVLTPPPTTSLQPPPPTSNQKLVPPSNQKLVGGGGGQTIDNTTTSEFPKTLIKTNTEKTDDDEALAGLVAALKQAAREVTGKEASAAERRRWDEVAEVLVTELKIAAGRTTVSSVPAFLAEHLRRRLWKRDKRELEAEAAPDPKNAPGGTHGPAIDPSECPDCFGTGMFYPEGYDKGVARCPHVKLTAGEGA